MWPGADHKFRCLAVNREKARIFDDKLDVPLETAGGDEISIYSQFSEDGKEKRLVLPFTKESL